MTPDHEEAYARHLEANPKKPVSKKPALGSFDPRWTNLPRNEGRTKPSGPSADPSDVRGA